MCLHVMCEAYRQVYHLVLHINCVTDDCPIQWEHCHWTMSRSGSISISGMSSVTNRDQGTSTKSKCVHVIILLTSNSLFTGFWVMMMMSSLFFQHRILLNFYIYIQFAAVSESEIIVTYYIVSFYNSVIILFM